MQSIKVYEAEGVEGGYLAVDDAGTAASALLSPLNCLVHSYPLLV